MADYIIELYNWFVNKADKKIEKPKDVEFPIWCSISKESTLAPQLKLQLFMSWR